MSKLKRRFYLWESRGLPKRLFILKKSRHIQRWFLRNPWIKPMITFNLAAIRIQALVRKCIVRTHGKNWRNKIKRKKGRGKQLDKYLLYLDTFSGLNSYKKPTWIDDGYSAWCAVKIQSIWRMYQVRKKYLLRKDIYHIGAIEIQTTYSEYQRRKFQSEPPPQNIPPIKLKTIDAYARIIQKAWRAFCNMRVYRYLRDLIINKLRGIPADLLRSIIPIEADLLDRASGVHIRFRLGGIRFPPKIYYKIYTHRPLCDINAFAPRNYSLEKRIEPSSLHNKTSSTSSINIATQNQFNSSFRRKIQSSIRVGRVFYDTTIIPPIDDDGFDEWYQREDDRNNPWRIISTEIEDILAPAPPWIHLDKDEKKINQEYFKKMKKKKTSYSLSSQYHYSKLKRQQDIDLERKRRKREWMLKAYMLTAGSKGIKGGDEDQPDQNNYHNYNPNLNTNSNSYNNNNNINDINNNGNINENDINQNPIEMCDSFSSRASGSERSGRNHDVMVQYRRPSDLLVNQPFSPTEESQFDEQKLLEQEKEKISQGIVFRYSNLENKRDKITSLPTEQMDYDAGAGGTDETLLKWSMALNYEEYSRDWLSLATSLPSDSNYDLVYDARLKIK